ncbi:MAG TPA: methyltransferase [Thermomonospora sp.]|nr:methyltransferase [Thermomonospora sp.]
MPSNTEIIKSSYEAFRRGDVDAAMAAFAPDISWTHPDGMNDYGLGGTEKGHAEVRAFMARARSVFSGLGMRPTEFLESGDRVVVLGVNHMRSARTGRECELPCVHVWTMRDGKATHFTDLHDTAPVRGILEDGATGPWPVIETGLSFWKSRVLLSAIELGVFGALREGPLTAERLTERLKLDGRGVRDFLDALVAMGMLDRDDDGYRTSAASARFLDEERQETYVGGLLTVADRLWYDSWRSLTEALRTGKPQNAATTGEDDPFAALYADPERTRQFQSAMSGGAMGAALALAEDFPWGERGTVADVGAAGGAVLRTLLTRHPHLRGIGFDLPPVEPSFRATAEAAGLADRMTFVPGDFFTDPMPTADVIVLGHVLHDWDEPAKRALLRKAYDALPPGGAVVVYDTMIDDSRRENLFGLLTSLHMLLESPGGFDYTRAEVLGWLAGAGFERCAARPLSGPESIAIGHKG